MFPVPYCDSTNKGTETSAVCTVGQGQVLSAQWDKVKCCLHSGTGTNAACTVGQTSAVCTVGQGQMLSALWDRDKCCLHSGTGSSAVCTVGQGQELHSVLHERKSGCLVFRLSMES